MTRSEEHDMCILKTNRNQADTFLLDVSHTYEAQKVPTVSLSFFICVSTYNST